MADLRIRPSHGGDDSEIRDCGRVGLSARLPGMSEPRASHDDASPQPWKLSDFAGVERLPDERPRCAACAGTGKVRKWSTPFAIVALLGFAGAAVVLYQALVLGHRDPAHWRMLIVLLCLGVFGVVVLVDRGDCSACEGHGRIEGDEDGAATDPLDNAGVEEPS